MLGIKLIHISKRGYWLGTDSFSLISLITGSTSTIHISTCLMMTSWHGTFLALLAFPEGNPPVTVGFPSQGPSNVELECFLTLAWIGWQSCWDGSTHMWRQRNVAVTRSCQGCHDLDQVLPQRNARTPNCHGLKMFKITKNDFPCKFDCIVTRVFFHAVDTSNRSKRIYTGPWNFINKLAFLSPKKCARK